MMQPMRTTVATRPCEHVAVVCVPADEAAAWRARVHAHDERMRQLQRSEAAVLTRLCFVTRTLLHLQCPCATPTVAATTRPAATRARDADTQPSHKCEDDDDAAQQTGAMAPSLSSSYVDVCLPAATAAAVTVHDDEDACCRHDSDEKTTRTCTLSWRTVSVPATGMSEQVCRLYACLSRLQQEQHACHVHDERMNDIVADTVVAAAADADAADDALQRQTTTGSCDVEAAAKDAKQRVRTCTRAAEEGDDDDGDRTCECTSRDTDTASSVLCLPAVCTPALHTSPPVVTASNDNKSNSTAATTAVDILARIQPLPSACTTTRMRNEHTATTAVDMCHDVPRRHARHGSRHARYALRRQYSNNNNGYGDSGNNNNDDDVCCGVVRTRAVRDADYAMLEMHPRTSLDDNDDDEAEQDGRGGRRRRRDVHVSLTPPSPACTPASYWDIAFPPRT